MHLLMRIELRLHTHGVPHRQGLFQKLLDLITRSLEAFVRIDRVLRRVELAEDLEQRSFVLRTKATLAPRTKRATAATHLLLHQPPRLSLCSNPSRPLFRIHPNSPQHSQHRRARRLPPLRLPHLLLPQLSEIRRNEVDPHNDALFSTRLDRRTKEEGVLEREDVVEAGGGLGLAGGWDGGRFAFAFPLLRGRLGWLRPGDWFGERHIGG